MRQIKLTRSIIAIQKWQYFLIECQICGEKYTGSTKTKYRPGASNYKSTQSKFINKEAVPKQALKKPFS